MTLPVSGPISFNAINVELGQPGTTQASLGQASYRALAGVASGAISLSNFYGKSSVTYKGILARAVSINSWYTAAGDSSSTTIAQNSTVAAINCDSTTKSGYVAISKSTSSYLGAYGLSSVGATTSVNNGIATWAGDKWGNYWTATRTSVDSSARFVRISAASNYSTITHQWNYYCTTTVSNQILWFNATYPLINDPNYSVIGGGENGRGYYLKVDSSGNLQTFNNTPSTVGSSVYCGLLSGGTANNEYVALCSSASGLSAWGANNLITRMNSSLSIIAQYLQDAQTAATNSGKNAFTWNMAVGPITNIMRMQWSGRYGGTGSTFGRACAGFYSMGSSGSQPTLLAAFRTNTSNSSDINLLTPVLMIAVYNGYEYWAALDWKKIYKVNSSGLIVQGWASTIPFVKIVCNDFDGSITILNTPNTSAPNTFQGVTTIDRLLTNQVTGWGNFSDYSNYNGQYFYNIGIGPISMNAPFGGAVSYPFTKTNWPGSIIFSASSDQSLYSVNATDMGGSIVNG